MDQSFLDNSLWRNIYCLLAGDSAGCSARDYASGLLPEVWNGLRLQSQHWRSLVL